MVNYRVLARKYRPVRLNEVIGQNFTVTALTNAFNINKLSHAFLFTGIRGVGKTTIARIIAMGLNCKMDDKPVANPCGKCENCIQILEDRYEDVLEIDAASNTSVDDVREIISSLKYRPSKGLYKVFIIDEVHMLSNSAFNALLKTVEEPPSFVKFIFCTTEIQKIPITIISRCQKYSLNRASIKEIYDYLFKIKTKENIDISDEAIKIIARNSEGSIRDSLTILDQCILGIENSKIDSYQVNKIMGFTNNKNLLDLFKNIIEGNISTSVEELNKIYYQGVEPSKILEGLLNLNYNLISALASGKNKEIYDLTLFENISKKCNIPLLNQIWQMLVKGKQEMIVVAYPIEALEITIIRIAYTCRLPSLEEVVNSIKKEKNNELNLNIDNNEIGNDIKKILEIFPDGEIVKKD